MRSLLGLVLTKIFMRYVIKTWSQSFGECELVSQYQNLDYMICLFYSESNTDRKNFCNFLNHEQVNNKHLSVNILTRTGQFPSPFIAKSTVLVHVQSI